VSSDDREDVPEDDSLRARSVPDVFRKLLIASVGAVFMTEEGIRSLVRDLKLPKELIAALLAQADRTKGDVVRVMGQELRSFLQSTKVREDLVELLNELTFEVKAEIKVRPREAGGSLFKPEVVTRVERGRTRTRKKKPAQG
jgi:hypothetical protein